MGKKSKKTKRKSELKIIFFIILIAAALFIVSTYAWFTTQRNVSITNLNGYVQVAEGLEISLDANKWSSGLKIGDGQEEYSLTDANKTGFGPYAGHNNLVPTIMMPVSTLGSVAGQTTLTDIPFLRGKVTNSKVLENIVQVSNNGTITNTEDAEYAGYIAFDVFLKNSSKTDTPETLQLNYDSFVQVINPDNAITGIQNTPRVAFALFANKSSEGVYTGVTDVNANQDTILKTTGVKEIPSESGGEPTKASVYINDVAIWEPNSSDHAEYIVTNNNNITWASPTTQMDKYTEVALGEGQKKYLFTTETKMPTYALKTDAIGKTIQDIYNWDGATNVSTLGKQMVLQTTRDKTKTNDYKIAEGVKNLISTSSTDETKKNFVIPANKICRLRIYVWLEGQDVDCINYASHGGGININIGLVKGETEGSKGVTTNQNGGTQGQT